MAKWKVHWTSHSPYKTIVAAHLRKHGSVWADIYTCLCVCLYSWIHVLYAHDTCIHIFPKLHTPTQAHSTHIHLHSYSIRKHSVLHTRLRKIIVSLPIAEQSLSVSASRCIVSLKVLIQLPYALRKMTYREGMLFMQGPTDSSTWGRIWIQEYPNSKLHALNYSQYCLFTEKVSQMYTSDLLWRHRKGQKRE